MCWYTGNKNYRVARIAEKDIRVFKIVELDDNKIQAYFQDFIYGLVDSEENIVSWTELFPHSLYFDSNSAIGIGYHSYSEKVFTYPVARDNMFPFIDRLCIADSFYILDPAIRIMECVIPAGTEYFINEQGEIVSEIIRPIKIHKPIFNEDIFSNIY